MTTKHGGRCTLVLASLLLAASCSDDESAGPGPAPPTGGTHAGGQGAAPTGGGGTGGSHTGGSAAAGGTGGSGATGGGGPMIGPCPVFPADHPWNTPIDTLPVHSDSNAIIANMAPGDGLHRDCGEKLGGSLNGIPYHLVDSSQSAVDVTYGGAGIGEAYPEESDCGPMPLPTDATVEGATDWGMTDGSGDRHVIVVDIGTCVLYELYLGHPNGDGSWRCGTSAWFDLTSNDYRPMGWTSADAAGLPVFPGLVRLEEVEAAVATDGDLGHAVRFTMEQTRRAFVLPATHFASSDTDPHMPPMGLRVRLKASFDIAGFSPRNQVLLRTFKRYGMILADNGGDWFFSGVPDLKPCDPADTECTGPTGSWTAGEHAELKTSVHGSDFEVVDTGKIYVDWAGVTEAESEVVAKLPVTCQPPWQTGLECVCY